MAKETKEAKTISNVKDLQGVKPLEEINLTYYVCSAAISNPKAIPQTEEGMFAGSFEVKDNKYIVIAKTKHRGLFPDRLSVSCSLYREVDNHIISDYTFTQDNCKHNEPGFSLENEVKKHIDALNRIKLKRLSELEESNQLDETIKQ